MSNEFVFTSKFGSGQVFDCQRSPAYPEAGKNFEVSYFRMPFKPQGGQFTKADLEGRYFQFKYEYDTEKVALYLFNTDGTASANLPEGKVSTGDIYGLGNKGFLYVSCGIGYFFANRACYFNESCVSYVPSTGKATLQQLKDNLMEVSDILAKKFGSGQVFDCLRSPAYPEAGKNFEVSSFTMPFKPQGGQFTRADLEGCYFQFKYEYDTEKVALYLFNADGTASASLPEGKVSTGDIYGLGNKGFLYVSGWFGYFFANRACYFNEGCVNYVPSTGKATLQQLGNYY